MPDQNGGPPEGSIRIVIDYNPTTGECGISGPMEHATVFLGMLETAKMVMYETRAAAARKAAEPAILRASPLDLSQITGERH